MNIIERGNVETITRNLPKGTNLYKPYVMRVAEARDETYDVRTLRLEFQNVDEGKAFSFKAGQFGLYSVFGEGEAAFCIASSPTRTGYIECTFRKAGRVTRALWELNVGETMGFRGPYGNVFPIDEWRGKSLLFVAGGIALPPLRCLIWNCLDRREEFKDITIVYGARTVADLVYKDELKEWNERSDVRLVQTVDPGGGTADWAGKIGFVPTALEESGPKAEGTIAIVCGPPIMIKFTMPVLEKADFRPESVYTTLENRMKCGVGKCGRCNVGPVYVCKEGPVFTLAQLKKLPAEF
jgi:NAD(P)H-flavin reductase